MSAPFVEPNPECPGCQALQARLQELEVLAARLQASVEELTARLNQNSSNSSRPPSADPPGAPRKKKPPTGRKRGGQPGHRGTTRRLLPLEQVDAVVDCVPESCDRCGQALLAEAHPQDPAPWRHQVLEVPPLRPEVTEYRRHARTCARCGKRTWGALPAGVPTRAVGPRLQAMAALLSGACRSSRRTVQALLADLFGVSLSLGTLSALEAATARALESAYQELAQAVARAPALNVDETGWKEAGERRWLWTATTKQLALFRLDRHRSQAALETLLAGEQATITSDRYSAYAKLPLSRRALCWAHLARDFRALAESSSASMAVGNWALDLIGSLFEQWRRFRKGEQDREALKQAVAPLQEQFRTVLRWGVESGCRRGKALCRDLLKHWEALWTWVEQEDVEPTNNAAERALRPAVLWRKSSFGHQSERGQQFVERLLTTVTTLRLQKRNVWRYLEAACGAALAGTEPPSLLPST